MVNYTRDCCVHGFHVYHVIWEATLGEVLDWYRTSKLYGRYAVGTPGQSFFEKKLAATAIVAMF